MTRILASPPGTSRGCISSKGENLNVALSLAQQAKRLLPELDSITDTLALAYYKEGLYANALPMFRECVRKAPSDPIYRYHLGIALLASGDKAKGDEELQSALRLNLQGDDALEASMNWRKHR